jgi:hypothetical protein
MDTLTELAIKYKTDRWGKHHYSPLYYDMFKNNHYSVKKIIELGVGEGAGLYMWRDFFHKAWIFGAEIDPKRCFDNGRIHVFQCDQTKKDDLFRLIVQTGRDIDIFIDDGSHKPEDQVFTCLTLMPMLKRSVIYIIEDVSDPKIEKKLKDYDTALFRVGKRYDDQLLIVRNKL